jgi:hypothetical protein
MSEVLLYFIYLVGLGIGIALMGNIFRRASVRYVMLIRSLQLFGGLLIAGGFLFLILELSHSYGPSDEFVKTMYGVLSCAIAYLMVRWLNRLSFPAHIPNQKQDL